MYNCVVSPNPIIEIDVSTGCDLFHLLVFHCGEQVEDKFL